MKQKRTAGSSTEAEYIALYEAVKECIWLKNILSEIDLFEVSPVVIYEDNSSTLRASENPVEHSKLKHMEINIHAIRDYISSSDIIMQKIVSIDQLADLCTKPHPIYRHDDLVNRILFLHSVDKFSIEH